VSTIGRFVAFEGGEGCGKSTQARLLADELDGLLTREPGGTPFGSAVRAVLLDPATGSIDPRAEALLMAADRAEHVSTIIRPALAAGTDVVCDRFSYSTMAYQGFGRGLPVDELRTLCNWASDGLWPDLTLLIDVDHDIARARLGDRLDRFEREGADFHERVRRGFLEFAAEQPERFIVVDGSSSVEAVAAAISQAVAERLGDVR
jgi:dTMP kinase